ncbi:hypothetical protein OIU93_07840 [Paeniglutamicibacter sp. ZC-3]|uniref:hypothetical protein n=1 Tax=Paeniglutamicibacter sp. ZC-3 TaxID=2986919 RepID=UPI0021F7E4BF|nr:hypothetical protein [Paeniglutamicibacter sp. ZC-3]MCV9994209.1 hypothetical protein [Paeniglutamicibacter sp. ZC-3]
MSKCADATVSGKPKAMTGALCIASLLGLFLLSGCADPGQWAPNDSSTVDSTPFGPPQEPSDRPVTVEGGSAMATPSPKPAEEVDTTGWKTFATQGLSFRYPPDWNIEEDDCSNCNATAKPLADPFTKWDIENSDGNEIAEFRADSATDIDGDTSTYKRTVLESTPVEGGFLAPAEVVFEHFVLDIPGKTREQKVLLMLNDAAATKARDMNPALSFFLPKQGLVAQLTSSDDLAEELGFHDDHVSLADAGKIMQSRDYRLLRAVMLSMRVEK